MNKKRYLAPQMTVVNVEGEAMMVASQLHEDDSTKSVSATLGDEEEGGDAWKEGL